MIKRLQRLGNSHALVLDKAMLEALGISPDSRVQLTVSGNSLIVTPENVGIGDEEVRRSIEKLRPRYADMLRRLAE